LWLLGSLRSIGFWASDVTGWSHAGQTETATAHRTSSTGHRHSDWVYPIRWAVTICGTRGSLLLQFEIAFMESLLDSLKEDVGANWHEKKEPKRQLQQPIARAARAASMSGC